MDLYDKVRNLKRRYEKTSVVPTGEDELQMYNLSDAIWGETAKEAIAAAAAQNDSTVTKSKKGQSKKEKMHGNSKGGALEEAANQNGDTQRGSKQQRNGKEKLGKDAKSGTSKETATQNGDALTKHKRGKMDKDKMDMELMPKDVSTGSQNGGTRTEEETHEEEKEIGASAQGARRSFDELQNLYPSLAGCVEGIESQHPCGETLRRAFGSIGDEKANALESKIKSLRLAEVKADNARADLRKLVVNFLLGLMD